MTDSESLKSRDTVTLAKQGDPELIASFLNRKLASQDISTRVKKKQEQLLVLLEGSNQVPHEQNMVKLLEQIAAKLDPKQVEKIRACGRQKGEEIPSWLKVIEVKSSTMPQADLKDWLESVKITPSLSQSEDLSNNDSHLTQGQRFIRFHLGSEETALLPVTYVREVLSISGETILPVPDVARSILGIHNWRGEMLWLVDLNDLLGFSPLWEIENITANINIIVLQVHHQELGIAVSQVETIEQHDWQKLQPPEGLFPSHLLSYVQGYLTQASSIILDAPSLVNAFSS